MKIRSFSAPKLKQIQSARIKDGRTYSPFKQYPNTAYKQDNHNPEIPSIQSIKQQNYIHQTIANKLNTQTLQPIRQSPIKQIIHKTNKPIQQTFNGRKLQYPHSKNACYQPQPQQSQQLQRTQSAQTYRSKHFVDRSVKSRKLIDSKLQFHQKFKVAFDYLLTNNKKYLHQFTKMCLQKSKPREQNFKIDLAPTPTTYVEHYPPKNAPYQLNMEPQNQKTSLSLGPKKVCGNSTTKEKHQGKYGPRADLATWPEGFKLQGPLDSTTTYANHYPNNGDYQAMVPIAKFQQIVRNMPFNPYTTYSSKFKGQHGKPSDLAQWDNLHPYGNDFDPNRGSTYSNFHNNKQKQPIQQWPNYDPRLIVSAGKFPTQYKSQFVNKNQQQLKQANRCPQHQMYDGHHSSIYSNNRCSFRHHNR